MGSIPGFLTKHLDLFRIQDRILSRVFGGTPIVVPSSIESVRVPFKFKEEATLHSRYVNEQCDYASLQFTVILSELLFSVCTFHIFSNLEPAALMWCVLCIG